MVPVLPIVVGLTFADRLLMDLQSRDVSLVGIFEGKAFASFPSPPLAMVVFCMVNGGRGEGNFELTVFALDKNGDHEADDWIYRKRISYVFPSDDPNRVLNIEILTKSLRFPEVGDYLFTLTLEGKHIAERRMFVRLEE